MTSPDDTIRASIVQAGRSALREASTAEVRAAASNHATRMAECIKHLRTPTPFEAVKLEVDSDPPPPPDDILTPEERRHVRR